MGDWIEEHWIEPVLLASSSSDCWVAEGWTDGDWIENVCASVPDVSGGHPVKRVRRRIRLGEPIPDDEELLVALL